MCSSDLIIKANPFVRTRNGILIDAAVKQIFLTASFLRCVKGSMFAGVQQLRKKNSLLKGLLDLSMKRIMLSEWDCLQILLYNVLFVRLISIVLFVRLNSTPNRNLLLQITVFSIIETFH